MFATCVWGFRGSREANVIRIGSHADTDAESEDERQVSMTKGGRGGNAKRTCSVARIFDKYPHKDGRFKTLATQMHEEFLTARQFLFDHG